MHTWVDYESEFAIKMGVVEVPADLDAKALELAREALEQMPQVLGVDYARTLNIVHTAIIRALYTLEVPK